MLLCGAPRSTLNDLRAGDIVAEADMGKLTDINTIAISFSSQQNMDAIESIKGNRDVVRLNVEEKSAKWTKIVYNIVGEVADGHIISNATLDQNLIEVSGPKSVVDQISYAGVEIDVSGATTNQSANLDIAFYDKEHNPINQDNLKKNVQYVRMTVDVLATKEVPVEVDYMGVPAEGYMATGMVQSDPATVKLAGTAHALSNISKISIPEERLNITGETSNMTDVVNLKEYLPDNIKLADNRFNGKVAVTVFIEPIAEKVLEIPIENISIINQPEGMEAMFPENVMHYTVRVSGLDALVSPLRQEEVRGTVDVKAWMEENGIVELTPGVYTIPIDFNFLEDINHDEVAAHVTIS